MAGPRMQLAGYQPPQSVHSKAGRHLLAALDAAAGGELVTGFDENVTKAGTPMTSLIPRTAAGEFDLFYMASSYLVKMCPSLAVLDLPFPGRPRAELFDALQHGPLGRRLADEMASRTPFRLLGFWDNGLRHLSNAVRPILQPDDCDGLRIRTLDNAFHQAVFRAMGFEPVFIDMRDFPAAIAGGAVEAQENPLTNLITFEVHRHHRHVSRTGHFQGVVLVLANAAWFAALPGHLQAEIEQALDAATAYQRQLALDEDRLSTERLVALGTQIVPAEDIDLAAFRDRVRPLVADAVRDLSPEVLALLA